MKAIVFIDVQNDFITGALRNEKAIEVTPKIVEFAKECVKNGHKIYATRDTHERSEANSERLPDGSWRILDSRGYLYTLEGQKLPIEHCIENTNGWMLNNDLMDVLHKNCTFVNKPTFGSFDLAEIIEEDIQDLEEKRLNGIDCGTIDEIVLVGFVSSICVMANAVILRAKFPNMKITVMKDLCAGVTPDDHDAAMKVLGMQQIEVV